MPDHETGQTSLAMPLVPARFASKFVVDGSGCWLWTATIAPDTGYGQYWDGTRLVKPHRYAYEYIVGPIPDGLDIDHLCRVRHCVNPEHMEPVTRSVNLRRAMNGNRTKTHCPRGHEYSESNTRIGKSGSRFCIACQAERNRQRGERERADQREDQHHS